MANKKNNKQKLSELTMQELVAYDAALTKLISTHANSMRNYDYSNYKNSEEFKEYQQLVIIHGLITDTMKKKIKELG